MIKIRKSYVNVEVYQLLQDLRSDLHLRGINLLRDISPKGDDIAVTCPCMEHKLGNESKPSCYVLNSQKEGVSLGQVHCFTCGYSATLPQMIGDCFGRDEKFGEKWVLKRYSSTEISERPEIKLNYSRENTVKKNKSYVTEKELETYRYYHPYFKKRGINDEMVDKFDLGYDSNFRLEDKNGNLGTPIKCVTFPVYDSMGRCLFVARRSINGKQFFLPKDLEKPLYGLYQLPEEYSEVVVCESTFNTITSTQYGRPSVCLFGTGNPTQIEQLKRLPCRKIVLGLDPDRAGEKGCQRIAKELRGHKIVTRLVIPEGKDINDLTREEFDNLEEIFL